MEYAREIVLEAHPNAGAVWYGRLCYIGTQVDEKLSSQYESAREAWVDAAWKILNAEQRRLYERARGLLEGDRQPDGA